MLAKDPTMIPVEVGRPVSPRSRVSSVLIWFGKVLAVFGLIAMTLATESTIYRLGSPQSRPWLDTFVGTLPSWLSWALVTPIILVFVRRNRLFERASWMQWLLSHGAGVALVLPLQVGVAFALELAASKLHVYVSNTQQILDSAPRYLAGMAIGVPMMYAVIAGICYMFEYYRGFRERELRASVLETQLANAKVQMLKMQLHPHFLFNTLNAISALMHRDIAAAERMVSLLADMLRLTLDSGAEQQVALRRELEILSRYLEIEQVRFSDRLVVEFDVEPRALDAIVPSFVLQPLVENAIKHGIAPRSEGGRIRVSAGEYDGILRVEVRDNGVGLRRIATGWVQEGVGLRNTIERLKQLYGDAARLELATVVEGGVSVMLTLPYRVADAKNTAGEKGAS